MSKDPQNIPMLVFAADAASQSAAAHAITAGAATPAAGRTASQHTSGCSHASPRWLLRILMIFLVGCDDHAGTLLRCPHGHAQPCPDIPFIWRLVSRLTSVRFSSAADSVAVPIVNGTTTPATDGTSPEAEGTPTPERKAAWAREDELLEQAAAVKVWTTGVPTCPRLPRLQGATQTLVAAVTGCAWLLQM